MTDSATARYKPHSPNSKLGDGQLSSPTLWLALRESVNLPLCLLPFSAVRTSSGETGGLTWP